MSQIALKTGASFLLLLAFAGCANVPKQPTPTAEMRKAFGSMYVSTGT